MVDNGTHLKSYLTKDIPNLVIWSIRNFSAVKDLTNGPVDLNSGKNKCSFTVSKTPNGFFHFEIQSDCSLKCDVFFYSHLGTLVVRKSDTTAILESSSGSNYSHGCVVLKLSVYSDTFQSLIYRDTLIILCQIYNHDTIQQPSYTFLSSAKGFLDYHNRLAGNLASTRLSCFLKQDVDLVVGECKETVNKAVLCAVSPVFAKMFSNEMREQIENVVIVKDVEIRPSETSLVLEHRHC